MPGKQLLYGSLNRLILKMQMRKTVEEIDRLPVHFILCTERTGSTLLCTMLNHHPRVLSTSEEPFAVFFYKKYRNKINWTEKEIKTYVEEFFLMAEKSLELYFTTKENLFNALLPYKDLLNYQRLVKLTYLQFLEPKPKEDIIMIVDKQIKYFFYLPVLCEIFPDAKFVVLVRDVRDNVVAKNKRGLNSSSNAIYLSALWKYTYSNIYYLQQRNKTMHIVKYEDMAFNADAIMREISEFYGISYDERMTKIEGNYELFLKAREPFVDPEFLVHLKNFHSGLFSKPNTKKIGVYKNELDAKTEAKILKLNKSLFQLLGYEYSEQKEVAFTLNDRLQMLYAYLYRPFLLKWYFRIPFPVKLLIKKMRKKKVST